MTQSLGLYKLWSLATEPFVIAHAPIYRINENGLNHAPFGTDPF
jgi:hypothetical protein